MLRKEFYATAARLNDKVLIIVEIDGGVITQVIHQDV